MESDATNREENANDEALLTVDEAAKFLDTSKSTLYRVMGQGDIKANKVGKQWRFRKADLTAYLQRDSSPVGVSASARGDLDTLLALLEPVLRTAEIETDLELSAAKSDDEKVSAIVETMITLAIADHGSDIHLEPQPEGLRIRVRVDGVLQTMRVIPKSLQDAITTRLKDMAEMNVLERRSPQDGRILYEIADSQFDLRVSSLPTLFGEAVVVRILSRSNVLLGLEKLGLTDRNLQELRSWAHRPTGIVLTTGASGSGKTTLMYSSLLELDRETVKVVTIEDPVECVLPGTLQTPVNKKAGLTFAAAMRTFLRHDLDVALCGQLRDLETAQLCVEAALTGHMVYTSVHTDDAPSALVRLANMGVEKYLVASTVIGIAAVRLARRLCEDCKVPMSPDEAVEKLKDIRKVSRAGGYELPEKATFFESVGCTKCRNKGYRGRIGLHSLLTCTPDLIEGLFACESTEEMQTLAVASGMRTLLADGLEKAAAGETTIDEVVRTAWL